MAHADPVLTLLKLDGLTVLDYPLLIVVYLALYAALKRTSPSLMLPGTVLALVAITLYLGTNPAATMLVLAGQYAAAGTDAAASGIVPVTFGMVGLIFALGSLVPFIVWFILVGKRLWRLAAEPAGS